MDLTCDYSKYNKPRSLDDLENHWQIWKTSEHKREALIENKKCKFVWDFSVQTDPETRERQRDISLIPNKRNNCKIIDFTCPSDGRVDTKKYE